VTDASSWRPRLVALDVDGTLVDGDNVMSDAVRDAVLAIRDAGIETVISTGRAVDGVLDTVGKLGLDEGYAVASNGAVVFQYRDDAVEPVEVLQAVTFDASDAVRRVLELVPDAIVAVEEVGVGFRLNRPFPENEVAGQFRVEDVESLIAEPVTRVVIRSTDHTAEEFTAIVHDLGLTGTNYYIGYSAWLDLAPEGVSKASGLEFLCDRLGIDRADVLAVGDGNNDLEMVRWAGRGVAMGHGPDVLKQEADAVTGSIADDGLVAELRRYL
jgi:Cof subfamily protein (haloacid dehalogenase superfamily)